MSIAASSKVDASAEEVDRTFELIVSDVGEMTIVLRPKLPFTPEGYRIPGDRLEIFGEGQKISFSLEDDILPDAKDIDQALLLEYGRTGAIPERELDLLKS